MLTDDRHRGIVSCVQREGSATVADLSARFDVSEATIRRDLDQLAEAGLVRRVRGGASDPRAAARPEADPRPFADVARSGAAAKREVARAASRLIRDGDVLALDIGTTVAALCPYLGGRGLTVVTASLAVLRELWEVPDVDVVVLGGMRRPSYDSLVGSITEESLRQFRVDIAFVGTSGIALDGAVLDTTASEVPIKRGLLDISARSYLLAHHEKFPGAGYLEVAPLQRFTGIVTDRDLPPETLALADEGELEVHLP